MNANLIERLRSAARWGTMTSEFDASDRIEWMAADEIERLQRELAEAQRDAARYRWLRSPTSAASVIFDGYYDFREIERAMLCEMALDAAIDAAIGERP